MRMIDTIRDARCRLTISIEGIDRIGKQTQVEQLVKRFSLERDWGSVVSIEAPINDGVTFGTIYQMLHDGGAVRYPATFQGIQFANKLMFQTVTLPKLLKRYEVIIFDRWKASYYAYGRAAGISDDELSYCMNMLLDTDVTIILDGKPHPKRGLDVYELDTSFQDEVARHYRSYHKKVDDDNTVSIVDANGPIERVNNAIWDVICRKVPMLYDNVIDMTKRANTLRRNQRS